MPIKALFEKKSALDVARSRLTRDAKTSHYQLHTISRPAYIESLVRLYDHSNM